MTINSTLYAKEFDNKVQNLERKIKSYLKENNYNIDNINELIQWSHTVINNKITRDIYPNENCSSEIKRTIKKLLKEEFH